MNILSIMVMLCCFTFSWAQASEVDFEMTKYLKECGGKIYSKCDSETLNQKHIFGAARSVAIESGKKLMVIIGADWCPACKYFNEMVANDKDRESLFERVVLVELNGDLKSTKALAREIEIYYRAYPHAFILDPTNNETLKVFFPTSFQTVEMLVDHINLEASAVKKEKVSKPSFVGIVDTDVLELPIERHDGYGVSKFYQTPKTKAEEFVNQGIASFHVFHYLDAYRSFLMASKEDPNLVTAYVGQILSILNIGDSEDGDYFLQEAIDKINELKKTKKLSSKDVVWADFAISYYVYSLSSYSKDENLGVKSIKTALNDVIKIDQDNLDGQSLAVWLLISIFDEPKNFFQNIVKKDPQLVGPHHYLTHIAERKNDMQAARYHARIAKDLAPGSAHAQHMYGHTLPQKGAWKEALDYFKLAHELHIKWTQKYDIEPAQDWHFAHNLDLMAATHMGLGEFKEALLVWKDASELDSRAYIHFIALSIAIEEPGISKFLAKIEKESPEWADYLANYIEENNFDVAQLNDSTLGAEPEKKFDLLLYRLKKSFLAKTKDTSQLSSDIIKYFGDRFTQGGFDGWSNAYIELLRLKRIAKKLSMDSILEDLEPLEFTIQTGSLCGGNSEGQSLTKCVEIE